MKKEIINSENAPKPIGPYNQAIMSGNTLYISGQIALDSATGQMINADIQSETKKVMENIAAILEAAGLNFNHVVKCSIFLKDLNNFSQINEIYGSYFESNYPARECVEVARLPKDVNVEISTIAVKF